MPYVCSTCMLSAATPFPSPFQNQTELRAKPIAKKWLLPTFSPGNFSLRAGLQVLNLIKIRRHKPPALNMSASQAGGWCQGRGGDLVCGQADAPQGHSPDDCPHTPPMTPHWVTPAQTALPQPSSAPPVSSSTQNIIWDVTIQKCLEKNPPEIPIPCCWGPCTRMMAGTWFPMSASQTAFPSVSHKLCFT